MEADILRRAWHGERPADHGFSAAVISYLKHQERSPGTIALVRRLVLHFADAPLSAIGQEAADKARHALLRPGHAPATVKRNILVPLTAILTHASRRGWCAMPNLEGPDQVKARTPFLQPPQATALLDAARPELRALIHFFLCTGCRTREALTLEWSQVDLAGARVILWEDETKAETRRVVHLPPAAVATLAGLAYPRRVAGERVYVAEREGRVFRDWRGWNYRDVREGGGGGQLRTAWARACRVAGLPGEWREWSPKSGGTPQRAWIPEVTPHDLRHTWATWCYALDRDLLRLKDLGGWSSVTQVERYAHLMPVGHEAAIRGIWGIGGAGHAVDTRRIA
jgi:integrase